MQELTKEEIEKIFQEVGEELEKIRSGPNPFIKEYNWAHRQLKTNSSSSQKEIEGAYKEILKKYHTDKWKRGKVAKECKEKGFTRCGIGDRDSKFEFHSEKCKNDYKKYLRNLGIAQRAYNFLTSNNRGSGPTELDTCDYCKQKYDINKRFGFKQGKGENIYYNFCSEDCYNKFDCGPKECCECGKKINDGEQFINLRGGGIICLTCTTKTCGWCGKQQEKAIFENSGWIATRGDNWFCCRQHYNDWLNEDENEEKERQDIKLKLKKLPNWNSLSDEEKQNFIEQVNNSESEQFENILQQARNLIREKQALSTQGRESKKNNSGQNHTSDNKSDSGYDSNNSQDSESEETTNLLSLAQSQVQVEEKIQKLLKNSNISEAKLNQILGGTDWKEALKKLDTPQKIADFINKIEQEILKIKLSEQSTPTKDNNPKNKWVLPVIILVVSLLALTSLILIVRRKRLRGGI